LERNTTRQDRTNTLHWLPPTIRRTLRAIATAERMTVWDLVVTAVRELVAAYPPRPKSRSAAVDPRDRSRVPQQTEPLETVWAPHRDAPSLLGDRESKAC
jgi:hypothetical protein